MQAETVTIELTVGDHGNPGGVESVTVERDTNGTIVRTLQVPSNPELSESIGDLLEQMARTEPEFLSAVVRRLRDNGVNFFHHISPNRLRIQHAAWPHVLTALKGLDARLKL